MSLEQGSPTFVERILVGAWERFKGDYRDVELLLTRVVRSLDRLTADDDSPETLLSDVLRRHNRGFSGLHQDIPTQEEQIRLSRMRVETDPAANGQDPKFNEVSAKKNRENGDFKLH